MSTMPTMRRLIAAAVLAGVCAAAAMAETAYPDRQIRLIVPYPPGGPTDVMARLIGQSITAALGQPVYIDNRPGAGSTLGGKIAAGAEPDGYTLLAGSAATLAIGPALYPDAGFDPNTLIPIASFASVPFVMVSGPKAPVGSVPEVIAYAKAHPGKLTLGVPNGAPPHMLAAWFKSLTATDILIVPYKGAANGITDILGGQIDLGIEPTSVLLAHLSGDSAMRPLAVTTKARIPELANVPTMIETGVPGYVATSWTGLVGPVGIPPAIVDKLNAAANAGLRSPDMQAKLKALGASEVPGTTAEFAEFVKTDVEKWTAMAKLSGIKGE
ncbi:MAG TPA: tripartite tricarboxylate transporter substrate binding protein [Xanthobacteraceae bacterium]|nr:tripartite tricarboxylate transporter substrate binding protein [Xanthobacteraceae bacterium]